MIEAALVQLDTLLLWLFAAGALACGVLMLVLRQPMRVALALIAAMICLAGIYGMLGVHFIAAFQVLIYVGAVMVFMVYVIMLLDRRDPAFRLRFSRLAVPGAIGLALFVALLGGVVWREAAAPPGPGGALFTLQQFSVDFVTEYWLQFELTSVLLLVAVVAALAVIRGRPKDHG